MASYRSPRWTNLEWFVREGRCWQRRRQGIEQVAWAEGEVSGTLRKAGFDRISPLMRRPSLQAFP